MKKLFALLLAALMLIASCAVAESVLMPNPWVEYESLETLNASAGTHLCLPGVMGITEISYRLLDNGDYKIAELNYSVNGTPYTMRASASKEDISGVYLEDGRTAFEGSEEQAQAVIVLEDCKLSRWLTGDLQYVLMVFDGSTLDAETFVSITEEIMSNTIANENGMPADGTYYDSVSQRAYLELTTLGDNSYEIAVHWSESAFADNEWLMTAAVTEDGMLSYSDCCHNRIVTAEDGTMTELAADVIPTGYFEVRNGALLWTGAAEVTCRDCVFELPAE